MRRPIAARSRRLAGAFLAIAALALGCTAARQHADAAPPPLAASETPQPPAVSRSAPAFDFAVADTQSAAVLYQKLCSHCHGPEAMGYAADHAPSLVNRTFLESATDFYLHHSIEQGRPGTSMAAYAKAVGGPLSSADIDRLVAWIRSHGPAVLDLTPTAPGEPARGQPSYVSHCQSCHGDLKRRGDAVMLMNPGFLGVASDEFIQHAILRGRPGTAMVSFRDTLKSQEVADLIAYLRTFERPVEANRLPAPTGKEPLFEYPRGRPPEFTLREDRFVGVDQVDHAIEQHRKLVIVDARPESDWMTTHIVGAVSIPYYQLKRLDEIPKDAWVVAYCACPHHLSGVVVDSLRAHGTPHAYVLDEGILEWERRGYPLVAAPGTSLPPLESPGFPIK